MDTLPISVVILTKNSEKTLERTLKSVQDFSEVVVYDTGSSDKTLDIARLYPNVRAIEGQMDGFGPSRNFAAQYASQDWILALDSDEALSEDLIQELKTTPLSSDHVYEIPFRNCFNGKWIRGCGWHPDRHTRLYNRQKTAFTCDYVHERILTQNVRVKKLKGYIEHISYHSYSDFIVKMERYSTLFAQQYKGKKKSSFRKALVHGSFAFIKSYILKWGIGDGKEGFIISSYNGQTAYYKYLKLAEYNAKKTS